MSARNGAIAQMVMGFASDAEKGGVLSYPLIFSKAKMQLEVGALLRRVSYDEF